MDQGVILLSSTKIRFLLVDDHARSRAALWEIVAAHSGWQVVADATDGVTAVSLAVTHRPDVIIMDISMPRMNGLQATRQIKAVLPESMVILFSAYTNRGFQPGSKEAGADFFIQKEKLTTQILDDIMTQIM